MRIFSTLLCVISSLAAVECATAAEDACPELSAVQSGPSEGVVTHRVSVFAVPMQCPAAPQIGCGSRARPILLELERDLSVSEAWLNRAGTKIAVLWTSESQANARQAVATKLGQQDATEIEGKPRAEAITEFLARDGWYRGAEVNRLSEEEAVIAAARFVHRLAAKTNLPQTQADSLQHALAEAIAKRTTDAKFVPDKESVLKLEEAMQQVAAQHLDARQQPYFREVIAAGWRPLANEN